MSVCRGWKCSLRSTTAGRSNTVTVSSGWALVNSYARAPVHPTGRGEIKTAEPPSLSPEQRLRVASASLLTSEVAGRFEPGEVKGRRHGLRRDPRNAVHGAHEPQLGLLVVVHGILENSDNMAAMRKEHDLFFSYSFHRRGQIITWNKSSHVLPKALWCWLLPSCTASSRWEKRGHTVLSQCWM